ncbi:MAG: hypothetical protein QF673_03715 [Candidatus Hydrothermarchaeota archaeon]|nr:hypothetical protein [Candidatus Hydrothermarchaeota archaeon]
MLEVKTEVRVVGHILERGVIFKLSEELKDVDVEVMHCEVSFAALKAGIEEKMPSVIRFYLVGAKKDRKKALVIVKKIAKETTCRMDYAKEKKG